MSLNEEKDLVRDWLDQHELGYTKITARTVGFMGRKNIVFVKVHGWQRDPLAGELMRFASAQGFRVEFAGSGFIS